MYEYQWNIFWAELDPVRDSEQSGKRPVIVISSEAINSSLPIVGVLPLTSMKKGRKIYSTEVFLSRKETGLEKDSISMSHQVRALSKNRLGEKCGEIRSSEIMERIHQSIRVFLDIE
ncbi:MAG: type II toxin-antitoxin system PemK/MazF family toxin [Actinobacteria bacterium]|jgi:mRNA interferase MazF|nr:type II toxin-antitoxin system PemK/MazF family toxin [Actinomycetota bacterium]